MKHIIASLLGITVSSMAVRADLKVVQTSEEIPERGSVTRFFIRSRAGDFALNPPNGWSYAADTQEETLTFQLESCSAVFSAIFLSGTAPKSGFEINRFVAEHWPNAQIVEQWEAVARDLKGRATECVYASAAATAYRTRVAFIPVARGYVEFKLTAPDEWPPQLRNSWTAVLNSFQRQGASAHASIGSLR